MVLKDYYRLTKPGIIYGNALTAAAGVFFAASGRPDMALLLAVLVGLSLVIASGCVCNNILDSRMDARMERTKNRAIPSGRITHGAAWIFAAVLGIAGVLVLYFFTTILALEVAALGWLFYVGLYTPMKPRSPMALYVGAVAGAVPPVVGYAAANILDLYALILFAALYLWQLPHFMSIALYRYDEYSAAGVPLFVNKTPSERTKYWARRVFYLTLVVMVVACGALILHR